MTEPEVVIAKVASIRGRVERIRDVLGQPGGRDGFLADVARIEQVAFNVLLAVQESVDLGSHIVADERWGAPVNLADVFDILHRHGVLSAATADAMRRGTKLRNLIAHSYGAIDASKLHDSAAAGLAEIEAFLSEVGAWFSPRASG